MSVAPPGPVAVGWATIDLERAAAELGPWLAPGQAFVVAPASALLGARCLRGAATAAAPAPVIVLLEPTTEGRVAAALARRGEGWCATWELRRADVDVGAAGQDDGRRRRGPTPGPLGREWLLPAAERSGPFRLVVDTATIER